MATLMQTFEQQYSALSAEITVKIGQVPNLHGGAKLNVISDVEHQIDEVILRGIGCALFPSLSLFYPSSHFGKNERFLHDFVFLSESSARANFIRKASGRNT